MDGSADALVWTRTGDHEDAPEGYRVQATRDGAGWLFSAWAPDQAPPGWQYRDYANGRCAHWAGDALQEHYPRGCHVPQRYPLLGVYPTAAEARRACEAHWAGAAAAGPSPASLPAVRKAAEFG